MTPMMRQYLDVKGQNPDSILFFRLGDFYEMFSEDAKIASRELDLVLTTRDRTSSEEERMPMCGVPYHSAEPYIAKLINKGYKVAICEQLEDPKDAVGIVARGVVRTVTPGTLMETSMLDEGRSNYLCCVYIAEFGKPSAVCFADLSTGEISVTDFPDSDIRAIENELASYAPSEALISGGQDMAERLTKYLKTQLGCLVNNVCADSGESVSADFGDSSSPFSDTAKLAVNTLLRYLSKTQKTDISHFQELRSNNEAAYMELDINTISNMELISTLRTGDKKGSLLWALDKTKTPMGHRLIRSWLLHPLISIAPILRRQSAVFELVSNTVPRGEIIINLRKINDLERLIGKIAYGNALSRDLKALSASILVLPEITAHLNAMQSAALRECASIDLLADTAEQIDAAIQDDPPFSIREGGFIKDGFDGEVDRLRALLHNSSAALSDIEQNERERTGKKLKIGYNKIFGYYIEISRSSSDDVPDNYIRKQTLANCERFITEELKTLETELLSAKDSLTALEYKLFEELRVKIAATASRVQKTARSIAELDALCSFAHVAALNNYSMPDIDDSGIIDIKDGRHPIVELLGDGSLFVPNDTYLDQASARTAIITGPNMAGKSTYMRQTALIVLMAQMGSFVPARTAQIGIADRVFTRIGAGDDLAAGKSTFMVEMTEVANILTNATHRSLLILDEIGRGTSTYDGMAIARAVLEYATDKSKLGAKTMFATHYHELTTLENEIEGVKNYNISAKKRGDDIIFLRKIVPGSTDDSYGIEVAGLAGVPESVIKRAKEALEALESDDSLANGKTLSRKKRALQAPSDFSASGLPAPEPSSPEFGFAQMSLLDTGSIEVADVIKATDLNTLSPLEALSLLFELKKKL
ncbi:MAG: DNA mismatch repair protein MutS [Oscillospiraceae bacterium]|nr:DNA mismatch repair protein MutS [Oscillospiraceae bacterium]